MKISIDKWEELSDKVLKEVRDIDDALYPKGGWKGWSTSGMRIMTNALIRIVTRELDIKLEVTYDEEL